MPRRSTFRLLRAARLLGATAVAIIAFSASGASARAPGSACGETSGKPCAQPNEVSVTPAAPSEACGQTGAADCPQSAIDPDARVSVATETDAVPCGEPGGADCIQP